jgi:hypothetical protein
MSIADQISKQMLIEIQQEIDAEIIESMMNMIMDNLFTDRVKLEAYLIWILNRDFDYLGEVVINFVAARSAINSGDMREMFKTYISSYQTLHGILNETQWRKYLVANHHDYEMHILGILPELKEVDQI